MAEIIRRVQAALPSARAHAPRLLSKRDEIKILDRFAVRIKRPGVIAVPPRDRSAIRNRGSIK